MNSMAMRFKMTLSLKCPAGLPAGGCPKKKLALRYVKHPRNVAANVARGFLSRLKLSFVVTSIGSFVPPYYAKRSHNYFVLCAAALHTAKAGATQHALTRAALMTRAALTRAARTGPL